jgi:phosphoribosylformylglycinamidine cyclo-ligase
LSLYRDLGVDTEKKGIDFFQKQINNLYPNAFCVIQKDPANPSMGLILHMDSAGSKPVQAYLHYKETGDPSWFKGLSQDALAMNVNDIICVGGDPITFSDYIAFNTISIDRLELLSSISQGFEESLASLEEEDISLLFAGGETADLPDQMRTLDICVSLLGRIPLDNVITGDRINPGDIIISLRSGGKVRYENKPNSGIMSNGLTLARNCLMKPEYLKKYPELAHEDRKRYFGRFNYDDFHEELGMTIGGALLSPTRFYAPIAKVVINDFREGIHGMVHNTGGGQTKCLRIGRNIRYIKDNLPEPDPIFDLIKRESGVAWKEMYVDFNMGSGFEFFVDPDYVESIISVIEDFDIGVNIIGRCERSANGNELIINSPYGRFQYS